MGDSHNPLRRLLDRTLPGFVGEFESPQPHISDTFRYTQPLHGTNIFRMPARFLILLVLSKGGTRHHA